MSEKTATVTIKPDDIVAYLKDHPQFLQDYPDILDTLIPPRLNNGKGIADFQSYMIERLKADKEEVIGTAREIVENTRANMNNQQRIHAAVLRLLESNSFDDFIRVITLDLAAILDVDIAVMIIESEDITHVNTSGIRLVPAGTLDNWMGDKPVLLQGNISGIEPIYGGGATLVQSQILLRVGISMDTPPAMIAFGSRNPSMFQPGQATDQILFLTHVIERCFRMWLNLPRG